MIEIAIIFLILITLGSAVIVAFSPNIVHSAFSLLLTLGGVAGFYAILGADFLAGIQVLVYVGGILVLIIFAVMLTVNISGPSTNPTRFKLLPALFALTFFILSSIGIWSVEWVSKAGSYAITSKIMGNLLLGKFLLPFEVISLLLLVALIGVVSITRLTLRTKKLSKEQNGN